MTTNEKYLLQFYWHLNWKQTIFDRNSSYLLMLSLILQFFPTVHTTISIWREIVVKPQRKIFLSWLQFEKYLRRRCSFPLISWLLYWLEQLRWSTIIVSLLRGFSFHIFLSFSQLQKVLMFFCSILSIFCSAWFLWN